MHKSPTPLTVGLLLIQWNGNSNAPKGEYKKNGRLDVGSGYSEDPSGPQDVNPFVKNTHTIVIQAQQTLGKLQKEAKISIQHCEKEDKNA